MSHPGSLGTEGSNQSPVWRRAVECLARSQRPLLTGHVHADGDALGSSVALWHGLRSLDKNPTIALHEPVPRIFQDFVPQQSMRELADEADARSLLESQDAVVVLDNNSWERLGVLREPLARANLPILCVDHHVAETPFCDLHVIDTTAAACGILVHELLSDLRVSLTHDMASALFVSLVNDTGWFRFSNADARAFRCAEHLVRCGAEPAAIFRTLAHRERLQGKRLLARFLETARTLPGGLGALGHVTHAMLLETGGDREDTETFIEHLRQLEGVTLCAFLREEPDRSVKFSFRSGPGCSARALALAFGGGGHEAAAGAVHRGPMSVALEDVERAMVEHLAVRRA